MTWIYILFLNWLAFIVFFLDFCSFWLTFSLFLTFGKKNEINNKECIMQVVIL